MKRNPIPTFNQKMLDRFMNKYYVDESGCWLWTASKDTKGYGQFCIREGTKRATLKAHRVAYTLMRGKIPDELVLDHLCRTRHCVNPAHLEPVTNQENINRGIVGEKKLRTHCKRGHELTKENAKVVKDSSCISGTFRQCKACLIVTNKTAYLRKKQKINT